MAKRAIGNYTDFKNFKVNMALLNQSYNTKKNNQEQVIFGGSFANNQVNMPEFLAGIMPKLQGGYADYKLDRYRKGGYEEVKEFNLFRDIFSPQSQSTFTNTNVLNDMTAKSYNYPFEQQLSRSSF